MKQIIQSLKTGETKVDEIPVPAVKRGHLLIRTSNTLVSAGTERQLVAFGRAGWIEKARQQPDKVRMVLEKIKTDGLQPTIESVLNKLNQAMPLGYCHVGEVIDKGSDVDRFSVGDRVISSGPHAEVVSVPVQLCARVPDEVDDEEAAFTVLGAVALQGIRLARPALGEAIVVIGLGLVGLMSTQLLRANGCRVLGMDFDSKRLELARRFNTETIDLSAGQDPVGAAEIFSKGRGVDAVLVTAGTRSSEPVQQAARMCRQRGRIVQVGVTGLELKRADFYQKELTLQVSCSYGPGRYDPEYEQKGHDYPFGLVRWTEQRNFEAVLEMMADGRVDVKPLISHRFDITDAQTAYELVGGNEPSLGILLSYPGIALSAKARTVGFERPADASHRAATEGEERPPAVSFIGAGNYATAVLIPAFKAAGVGLRSVASSQGISGVHAGRKYGFEETTTDTQRIFQDAGTHAVVITTRHDSHARYVMQALEVAKPVFVEKPLCLTLTELDAIEAAYSVLQKSESGAPAIMVGFNRRFSPQVRKVKELLNGVTGPKSFIMTVNAGVIPADHWTQDLEVGGGRILGEACHFIDLLRFLAGVPIVDWQRIGVESLTQDTASLQLRFADGSIGTVHYFANGAKSFPKERLEVFAGGRILQLDNYRRLTGFGWPGFKKMNLWRQDKGQKACAKAFVEALAGRGAAPIPFAEILEVSRVSIELGRPGR